LYSADLENRKPKTEHRKPQPRAALLLLLLITAAAGTATAGLYDVVVADNAGAGGHEQFPDICRLPDGQTLLCVFNAGYAHVSPPTAQYPLGGRISFATSSDEGRTWSAEQTLYDSAADDRDPSVTLLSTGRLLLTFFDYVGGVSAGTLLLVSDNGGTTWTGPTLIAPNYFVSSPVRELPGGRLVLGVYWQEPSTAFGAVILSDDQGDSWSNLIDIDPAGSWLDAETDVIRRMDGTLYAVQRNSGFHSMKFSVSSDTGETWSVSQDIGFGGHAPYLHRPSSDTNVILLGERSIDNTGSSLYTGLRYSTDECASWSEALDVGSSSAYASMVDLVDDTTLVVYYDSVDVKAFRLRATVHGIRQLEPFGAGDDDAILMPAWNPFPRDGAPAVTCEPELRWAPGDLAETHDVYFGTDSGEVASADSSLQPGVTVFKGNQAGVSYDPGLLQAGQTYYWRVDERKAGHPDSPWPGPVWAFTVQIPYADYIGAGHWDDVSDDGPMSVEAADRIHPSHYLNTVNGVGLSGGAHGTTWNTEMWLSQAAGANPNPGTEPGWTWIKYDFGRVYGLGSLWVWNFNSPPSSNGRGLRNVAIEYSTTGGTNSWEWIKLGDFVFDIASGQPGYTGNEEADFAGAAARYVVITAHNTAGSWGDTTFHGLSEVQFNVVPINDLVLGPIGRTNTTLFTLDTSLGVRYDLQFSTGPQTSLWQSTGLNLIGNGGTMTGFDPAGFSTSKTYRAVVK
jgi:hypothetical protein